MDNVSKIILDDSGYLPKLRNIGEEWDRVADKEEAALKAGQDALKDRVEGLDVLNDAFVENAAAMDRNAKATKTLDDAKANSAKSSGLLGKAYDATKRKLDSLTKSQNKNKDSDKKLSAERRNHLKVYAQSKAALKDQISGMTILGVNLKGARAGWKSLITVGRAWIKVLGTTKVAIASTGIGLLVLALGSLVSFLQNTIEGQDFLNRKLAAAGAIIGSVTDVAIGLGKAIFDAVSNPLQAIKNFGSGVVEFITNPVDTAIKIWERFKGAVTGFAKDVVSDATNAEDIAKLQQNLRDDERALRVEFAKTRAEIELRKKGAEDTNKTIAERKRLAKEAFELENGLLGKQIALAEQNVNLIKRKNDLNTSGNDDLDALADAEIELQEIRQGSFTIQTELQNKLNSLTKEQSAARAAEVKRLSDLRQKAFEKQKERLEALKTEYQDLATGILSAVLDLEISSATPIEQIQIKEKRALAQIQSTREKFLLTSKEALANGLISQADIDTATQNIDLLEKAIQRTAVTDAIKLAPKIKVDIKDVEVPAVGLSDFADRLAPEMRAALAPSFADAVGGALEDASNFLSDNVEKIGAFQGFFDNLTSLFTSGIETRIAAIDDLIEAQDEQIGALEDQLADEEAARDAGLANSVQSIRDEIAAETAEREAAIEQRQELERKAQKAQLINDTIQQSTSLITASANIFKAMSSIPFVGVPLAIGFIATMFAAFAKSKIDASKATKLSTGTGQIDGNFKTFAGHKSDLYGNGYAVVDADTGQDMGVRISGKESLTNEAVAQGVNRGFFEDLNAQS